MKSIENKKAEEGMAKIEKIILFEGAVCEKLECKQIKKCYHFTNFKPVWDNDKQKSWHVGHDIPIECVKDCQRADDNKIMPIC